MKHILLVGMALAMLQGCAVNIYTDSNVTTKVAGAADQNPPTWGEQSELLLKACQTATSTIAIQGGITAEDLQDQAVLDLLDEVAQGCALKMGVVI